MLLIMLEIYQQLEFNEIYFISFALKMTKILNFKRSFTIVPSLVLKCEIII
jgi:hypothetical protein